LGKNRQERAENETNPGLMRTSAATFCLVRFGFNRRMRGFSFRLDQFSGQIT
jgi:hypothetical protein